MRPSRPVRLALFALVLAPVAAAVTVLGVPAEAPDFAAACDSGQPYFAAAAYRAQRAVGQQPSASGPSVILFTDTPQDRIHHQVASYRQTGNTAAGKVIHLDIDTDSDVLEYWNTKNAYYQLEISGVLPENTWAVDVVVSFSGKLSISSN